MLMQDNILTHNDYGMKNHIYNQERWEQKQTVLLLYQD